MELNEEQRKYVDYLREKILPELQGMENEAIGVPVTNIEWNLKKVLGEVEGETIDIETYVQRTKADFAALEPELPEGGEAKKLAGEVLTRIEEFFGVAKPRDPEEVLAEADNPENLDWSRSVVDLLKLLGADSSWDARKRYAVSLGYPVGEVSKADSARMNIWLHKQILGEVARTGSTDVRFIA